MKSAWIKEVYLGGTIAEAIEALEELQLLYPEPYYELRTDQDNELWLVNTEIQEKIERERIKARIEEQKKEEEALYNKLKKIYGGEKK